jgi:ketosteroid isomerase-like protein
MTHDDVQRWLDRYIDAWRANEVSAIEPLFAEDAVYGYRPWDSEEHTVRGRDAIVASWLEAFDAPAGSWDAAYQPWAIEGNRAAVVGWSRYAPDGEEPERTYHNAFLIVFDDEGRCTSFHEFFMLEDSPRSE